MASLTTPRPVGFPDEKRDDVHKWLLWANERLTSEALETKLHKLCEGKSKTDERNLVIEKEIKEEFNSAWKKVVEADLNVSAEERLMTALTKFINEHQDRELNSLYQQFRSNERETSMKAQYGKEKYEAVKKTEIATQNFAMKTQEIFTEIAKKEGGFEVLNDMLKKLLPEVATFEQKIQSLSPQERSDVITNMELEEMKPIIKFKTLQALIGQMRRAASSDDCCNSGSS
jgi:hypothetical protein